jgi:N,N'-diacetyllegionaminate synthase
MFENFKKNNCYIIAEIGGNFTTFDTARKLIDLSLEAGVDAVKLQTYKADTLASKQAQFDMENTGITSQYDLFKKYEISEEMHSDIFGYAQSKGLDWFSTPAHETDVDMLEKYGVGAYKIGSDDAVNQPFLRYVASKNKPIILSTGMCTLQEVRESVNCILQVGNEKIILLHAITAYPTHSKDVNLKAMQTLKNEFPMLDIGYSDHTLSPIACIAAAAMGAKIIEKHFTYDKNAEGPDHMLSADLAEMKYIVNSIRELEIMMGSGIKLPAESEKITRINNRKSIVSLKRINAGERIHIDDVAIKRPGFGIEPKFLDQILGRSVAKDIEKDSVIFWKDLL